MTNKEVYGDKLEIVAIQNCATVYYRNENLMYLLKTFNEDKVLEAVEYWLQEECTYTYLYEYNQGEE